MFHLVMSHQHNIYHLPKSDAILIAKQDGDRLFIADIVAKAPISFEAMREELPFEGIQVIEFGFCPDWLGIAPDWEPVDMEKSPFFVKGAWNLPTHFRFPATSET